MHNPTRGIWPLMRPRRGAGFCKADSFLRIESVIKSGEKSYLII